LSIESTYHSFLKIQHLRRFVSAGVHFSDKVSMFYCSFASWEALPGWHGFLKNAKIFTALISLLQTQIGAGECNLLLRVRPDAPAFGKSRK
jgi:hypothetical protein